MLLGSKACLAFVSILELEALVKSAPEPSGISEGRLQLETAWLVCPMVVVDC